MARCWRSARASLRRGCREPTTSAFESRAATRSEPPASACGRLACPRPSGRTTAASSASRSPTRTDTGSSCRLLTLVAVDPERRDQLGGAEAIERTIDEEHLERYVGVDMSLAQEGDDLAPGQVLDDPLVVGGHHPLEIPAHVEHLLLLAALHHRLLDRGVPVAQDADDEVVEDVGLRLHRPAAVVLAKKLYDLGRDRGEKLAP